MIDGLRRGDRAAFDVAYARYRARVYAFLLRLSRKRDVAEDTDLAAWLFTVARNQFVSWRRWAALDLSRLVAIGDDHVSAARSPADETDASRSMRQLDA